jgi:hypothetical protein
MFRHAVAAEGHSAYHPFRAVRPLVAVLVAVEPRKTSKSVETYRNDGGPQVAVDAGKPAPLMGFRHPRRPPFLSSGSLVRSPARLMALRTSGRTAAGRSDFTVLVDRQRRAACASDRTSEIPISERGWQSGRPVRHGGRTRASVSRNGPAARRGRRERSFTPLVRPVATADTVEGDGSSCPVAGAPSSRRAAPSAWGTRRGFGDRYARGSTVSRWGWCCRSRR